MGEFMMESGRMANNME